LRSHAIRRAKKLARVGYQFAVSGMIQSFNPSHAGTQL
jgi:hypothetical protein